MVRSLPWRAVLLGLLLGSVAEDLGSSPSFPAKASVGAAPPLPGLHARDVQNPRSGLASEQTHLLSDDSDSAGQTLDVPSRLRGGPSDEPVIDMEYSSGDITRDVAHLLVPLLSTVVLVMLIAAGTEDITGSVLSRSLLSVVGGTAIGMGVRLLGPLYGINLEAWKAAVVSEDSMDKVLHPYIFLLLYPYLFWPSGWFSRIEYVCYHTDWMTLATLGPIISTLVTAAIAGQGHHWFRGMFYTKDQMYEVTFREIYLVSACVSVVDPTPLLFAIGELAVPPVVSTVVLWESLVAPTTATVLVNRASIPSIRLNGLDARTVWELVGPPRMVWTEVFPSILGGFLVGLAFSLVLRARLLRARPHWEAICIALMPILAHAIFTASGLWNILADVPCGMAMAVYGRAQLSDEGLQLADRLVTQNTILVCTVYYVTVSAYFVAASDGEGLVLGAWCFISTVAARTVVLGLLLPLCECWHKLWERMTTADGSRGAGGPERGRGAADEDSAGNAGAWTKAEEMEGEEERAQPSIAPRTSRRKLGAALWVGQTRGGVWFSLYFTRAICPNKALMIDACVVVWFLSQLTFGLVPRLFYSLLGLPSRVDRSEYEGDGKPYDELWYAEAPGWRPFYRFHRRVLAPLFADRQREAEASEAAAQLPASPTTSANNLLAMASFLAETSEKGMRWMGMAAVARRPRDLRRARTMVEMRRVPGGAAQ